jgi:2-amino-4-hydroxy-6-hydroxymethyldihydropteridine diphosphokinase
MPRALIGLGSNLGPREDLLRRALDRLQSTPHVQILARSRAYETRPVGGPPRQPLFLNAAAVVETSLGPELLLDTLLEIELALGRQRTERWAARPIDLDLLLYDAQVLRSPRLVLPHPRMAWRRFVLQPAAEVAGDWLHPPTGWTITRLLANLDNSPNYVAFAGAIGAGKTLLAKAVADRMGGRALLEPVNARRLATFYADPSGRAWATAIEFLDERARRLDLLDPAWQGPTLVASDFWFDQSLAFAQVWLPPSEQTAFRDRFEAVRQRVVRPRLIVLLEAPAEVLRARIAARARPYEQSIPCARLEAIAAGLSAATGWSDQGPVLRLTAAEPEALLAEVVAAIAAMR